MKFFILFCLFVYVNSEMVFEMRLVEFDNHLNRTYSNQMCGPDTSPTESCRIGFLFCLVDLPFRNPQNCSLGDHITPVLGSNHIDFTLKNFTYQFRIKKIPPRGIGMMVEVRDYYSDDKYQHVDFYTNALADVPLSFPIANTAFTVRKTFTSLFDHNSSLTVESKLYCANDYYGYDCETYCASNDSLHFTCDRETGLKICSDGFTGLNCDIVNICTTFPCLNNGTCVSTDDLSYYCECKTGFEGFNCEHNVQDPCYSMPCFNNGKCNSIGSKFMCECVLGFHGTYCEADLRRCTSNPCSSECECIELPSNMTYECKCPYVSPKAVNRAGFFSTLNYLSNAGPSPFSPVSNYMSNQVFNQRSMTSTKFTETLAKDDPTLIKKQPCVDFDPCKHGKCLLNNKSGEFRCDCEVGYMGPFCDLIRHPCDFKPCENGICEIVGDLYYKCLCKPNWTGVNCHIEIKPCDETKCLNGGKCKLDDIYGSGCDCQSGFTGYFCETEIIEHDACKSNPCQNEGMCRNQLVNFKSEYECLCSANHFGKNCELQRSTCETKQCLNGATCIQFNSTLAICQCTEGFFGELCQNDENECLTPGICPVNSFCNNKYGSYECICYHGYYMKNSVCQSIATLLKTAPTLTISISDSINTTTTIKTTSSIDKIKNTTKNTSDNKTTQPTISNVSFINPDFSISEASSTSKPDTDSTTILSDLTITKMHTSVVFETSTMDPSACNVCKNNSTCKLENQQIKCICSSNFVGKFCDEKIDMCAKKQPCLNKARCIQDDRAENGYTCECKPDYTGPNCETKMHVCESKMPCQNGGQCIRNDKFVDEFVCHCKLGFNGSLCENKLHVCDLENQCQNGGFCNKVEDFNTFTCTCASGFTGLNCEHEMDACISLPCKNGGLCQTRSKGTFFCDCPIGFNGERCEHDIDVCSFGVCKNNAECIEGIGENYTCICNKGFTGKACQIELDPCDSQPCHNDGKCTKTTQGEYKCECAADFTGPKCQNKIDKCKNFCTNNSSCIIENNEPRCVCDSFYFGEKCERSIKVLCENKRCVNNGHCRINDVTRMPECVCQKGYSGDMCETKNICLSKNQKISCFNNSTCLYDQNNQEFCECPKDFVGESCEISLRNDSSQSIARDASSLASSDTIALTGQANSENSPAADNGVWLIVIVFGYIFGLFLIFVIIWFIWYGTSIKRDRRSSSSSSQNNLNSGSSTNSNNFSSYSTNSSLNRQVGKEIINGFSPAHNMVFNNRDEYFQKNNLLTQDDLSGSHSTSFVHSYHHRI